MAEEGQAQPSDVEGKRRDYLSWDTYFMGVAFLTGMRSKDPSTQVGAVIVNPENRIVGVGYNGFPGGIQDEELPWAKESSQGFLHTKYPYVCHAELNAILNKNVESCRGCRLYSTLYPCCECAKVILQSGIRHVIYASDKSANKDVFIASKRLFQLAGIRTEWWRAEVPELRIALGYKTGLAISASSLDADDAISSELSTADDAATPGGSESGRRGVSDASSLNSSPAPKSAVAMLAQHSPPGRRRQVVLAVGLETLQLAQVQAAFSKDQEEVRSVAGCDDLLQYLRAGSPLPDVVLLEAQTSGIGSADACRTIRVELALSQDTLPIIMLCAEECDRDTVCSYLDIGCNDYLTKPIAPSLLRVRVGTALQARRLLDLEADLAARHAPPPPLPIEAGGQDDERPTGARRRHRNLAAGRGSAGRPAWAFPDDCHFGCPCGAPLVDDLVGGARGEVHDRVSVLLCDLLGACGVSSDQATSESLALLNCALNALDGVAQKHGVCRMDAFDGRCVFVAGHDSSAGHAARMVRCGLGMLQAARALRPGGAAAAPSALQLRFGAHTGPASSGIVGGSDPRHYLFGEAVEVARSMEASGVTDCLHLSDAMRQELPGSLATELGAMILQQKSPDNAGLPGDPAHIVVPLDGQAGPQSLRSEPAVERAKPALEAKLELCNAQLLQSPDSRLDDYYMKTSADCYR